MSISSSHQELFRQPSAAEKISFVRSLMETGDLHADVAMALLKSIHTELTDPQGQDHSSYASYARMMASLQHKMPDVHQHVVENWQASRREQVQPEEGFFETEADGKAKRVEKSALEEIGQDKEFWETEGEAEGMESEVEEERNEIEEKDYGQEREEEKGQVEEGNEEESGKEEREDEESRGEEEEQEHEPEQDLPEEEKEVEVEGDVEQSEIEQEALETEDEAGEAETDEQE